MKTVHSSKGVSRRRFLKELGTGVVTNAVLPNPLLVTKILDL